MRTFVVIAALVCAPCVFGEVADSSAAGFTVKVTAQIAAPPATVYKQLFRVGDWWNPQHTFSGDAHNLSIEEKAAGCFCEKLPNGGGVRHMQVVYLAPGKALVMSGAIGPLQSLAATGTMTFQLAADGEGTRLTVAYAVAGYLPAGMNTWAAPVDSVISEQIARLKSVIEKGNPSAK